MSNMRVFLVVILLSIVSCNISLSQSNGSCNYAQVMALSTSPCNYSPFVAVFEDDFNGNQLDINKWIPINGVVRDVYHLKERQWYTPNNILLNNGTLKLIAKKETLLNQCFTIWITGSGYQSFCQDFYYTSAEINSKYKFMYGKYEIRCKIPKGKGFWPAFWTYGGRGSEIDVFEFWNEKNIFGNYDSDLLSKVINTNIYYNHDNNNNDDRESCSFKVKDGIDYSQSFRTYTLIYNKNSIEWYVDNILVRKEYLYKDILGRNLDCGINSPTLALINKSYPRNMPMSIMANLAIQCNNNNEPDINTPFPSNYEIDYIRFYKQLPMGNCLVYNETSEVNLENDLFNAIGGKVVTLQNNISIPDNAQLKVLATDEINLNNGFSVGSNSDFEAKIIN